jgi:hypothetical protein
MYLQPLEQPCFGEDLLEACAEALAAKKSCSIQQHTQAVSICGHLIESEIHRHGPPIHDIVDKREHKGNTDHRDNKFLI